MDLLKFTREYAHAVHEGERFKYVPGIYFDHVKDVSARMHEVPEKVLAFLHDTLETKVRKWNPAPTREAEEAFIQAELETLKTHYAKNGFDITELLPELDVLTKRRAKGAYGLRFKPGTPEEEIARKVYEAYIKNIFAYVQRTGSLRPLKVKRADLVDNRMPARNPAPNLQRPKDHHRLSRYDWAIARIEVTYPEAANPAMRLHRISRGSYRHKRETRKDRKRGKGHNHTRDAGRVGALDFD